MPYKETVNEQKVIVAFEDQEITADGAVTGAIIDTLQYQDGVFFAANVHDRTDGTFSMSIAHGNDAALADEEAIADYMKVGDDISIAAADAEGSALATQGIIATKRYIQLTITGADITTGARVNVMAIMTSSSKPVS